MAMARRFHAWAPNIAVKLPAALAGLDVLEDCVAEGITATATVSFTVPQVVAIAERHRAGRQRALQSGVKPGKCFAVIMIGRLDDYLREVAEDTEAAGQRVRHPPGRPGGHQARVPDLQGTRLRGRPAGGGAARHLSPDRAGRRRLVMSIAPGPQEWFVTEDHPREERIDKDVDRRRRRPAQARCPSS